MGPYSKKAKCDLISLVVAHFGNGRFVPTFQVTEVSSISERSHNLSF
jgi:hypothetical protein